MRFRMWFGGPRWLDGVQYLDVRLAPALVARALLTRGQTVTTHPFRPSGRASQ